MRKTRKKSPHLFLPHLPSIREVNNTLCILIFGLRLRFSSKLSLFTSGYFKPECFCMPNTKRCDFCSYGLNKLEVNLFGQSPVGPLPYILNTGT